jgi:hypothetical protein
MTNKQKIEFIERVVEYRGYGYMSPGSPADWFYNSYYAHKDDSFQNLPKFVVLYEHEQYIKNTRPCILMWDKRFSGALRYVSMSLSNYIFDDNSYISKESAEENTYDLDFNTIWKNGSRAETIGKLKCKVVDEDYYINYMYEIAMDCYEKDIKPALEKEKIEKERKETMNFMANKLFGLGL